MNHESSRFAKAPEHLLRVVDVGIIGLIFVMPLFMGARGPVGRMVLLLLSAVIALAWCARQFLIGRSRWYQTGAEWLLLAGLLLVLLQLTPLPHAVLSLLSPAIDPTLPLWETGDSPLHLGAWHQLSLAPEETRTSLAVYVCYVLLFLVVAQRLTCVGDVERLLRWTAASAIMMAVLGLVQMFAGNGYFLWFYEHPSRTTSGAVKGMFQNQNHFAHFLALGIGPLIWWICQLDRHGVGSFRPASGFGARSQAFLNWRKTLEDPQVVKFLLWSGLAIIVVSGLLSFSRGGAIAILVALTLSIGLAVGKSQLSGRSLAMLGGLAAVVFLALCIYGYEPLAIELRTLQQAGSLEELSRGRQALWSADLEAVGSYWLLGTGAGSHAEVYRMFLDAYFPIEFTHAESSYLQLLLEVGVAGFSLAVLAIAILCRWCWKVTRWGSDEAATACVIAVVPCFVASLVHSVGDFVWYIPACFVPILLFAACVSRLARDCAGVGPNQAGDEDSVSQARSVYLPQSAWGAVSLAILILALAFLKDQAPAALAAPHWDAYRRVSRQATIGAVDRASLETLSALSEHLRNTLYYNPQHARANVHLAVVNLRRFDLQQQDAPNPMPLSQIRDAALASQFPSKEAQAEWLDRAVGENCKLLHEALSRVRRGLQLCPLQGEGYVCLANLTFLEGPTASHKGEYVSQALAVRPHLGLVLFAAGQEAALEGDYEMALYYWKRAFLNDPEVRGELIELLGEQMPPELIVEHFEPEIDGLAELQRFYRHRKLDGHVRYIAHLYAPALETAANEADKPQAAAAFWNQASREYASLDQNVKSLQCARNAVTHNKHDFELRSRLARLLVSNDDFDEAIEHLNWCLRRKPGDQSLTGRLVQAKRSQMEQSDGLRQAKSKTNEMPR